MKLRLNNTLVSGMAAYVALQAMAFWISRKSFLSVCGLILLGVVFSSSLIGGAVRSNSVWWSVASGAAMGIFAGLFIVYCALSNT